jgi:hypothetical protein
MHTTPASRIGNTAGSALVWGLIGLGLIGLLVIVALLSDPLMSLVYLVVAVTIGPFVIAAAAIFGAVTGQRAAPDSDERVWISGAVGGAGAGRVRVDAEAALIGRCAAFWPIGAGVRVRYSAPGEANGAAS